MEGENQNKRGFRLTLFQLILKPLNIIRGKVKMKCFA